MSTGAETSLAIIGAGPRGAGVIERIAANIDLFGAAGALTIHVIDPHPPGAGRIWRLDQSSLLRLNSMARDVTMFTDRSSVIEGPILPGPSLIEWAAGVLSGEIADVDLSQPHLLAEVGELTGASFPTRQLQSRYLEWFFRRAIAALPPHVTVQVREATAQSVDDLDSGGQRVALDDGGVIDVDLVLYALGHAGAEPGPAERELLEFAARHGLVYVPPAFTADADTSAILPGEPVLVRGMGLASTDLVVLLTEGRGGRFDRAAASGPDATARLVYLPSGAEPRLYLGSRRGVPYHSKISSALVAPRVTPRFFTAAIATELARSRARLDFRADVWPLIAKEALWGYYWELFIGHPDRVSVAWDDFADRFAPLAWDSDDLVELVASVVPDALDRVTFGRFDRPLAHETFRSVDDFQERIRAYVRDDLIQRSDPAHSATLGLFMSLLFALFDLGGIIDSPKWSAQSRLEQLPTWWMNLFSFIASGPPAHRLEELVALSEAGVVDFIGPDLWVRADESGRFVAGSPSVEREVDARVLVDARLPRARAGASDNPVLRSLVTSGVGSEEYLDDGRSSGSTGLLEVRRSDARVLDPLGHPHPRRFAIGPYTNAPFVGAFSRPNTNAVSFRENDRVARAILDLARQLPVHADAAAEPGRG